MPKIKKIFIVALVFTTGVCNAQKTPPKKSALIHTFDAIYRQQHTLNMIKSAFPKQAIEATIAEIEFNKNYGKALSHINIDVRNILGLEFKNHIEELKNIYNKQLHAKPLTEKEAIHFIKRVKQLAKGIIESRYLKTLQKYQVSGFSSKELFTPYLIHEVKSYSNTGIINVQIKIPTNWKEIDGTKTSVLKSFQKHYNNQMHTITIERVANTYHSELFSTAILQQFAPKNSIQNSTAVKILGNRSVGTVEYTQHNLKTDLNSSKQTLLYIIPKLNDLLIVYCEVSGKKMDNINVQIQKHKPLYEAIVASIDFHNQQKERSLYTYKN